MERILDALGDPVGLSRISSPNSDHVEDLHRFVRASNARPIGSLDSFGSSGGRQGILRR